MFSTPSKISLRSNIYWHSCFTGHPNVRLFITHGGLLGTQEAIYCGTPILGMPLFGDQYLNMAYFKDRGIGLELDYRHLTYDQLSSSLNKLLTNVR